MEIIQNNTERPISYWIISKLYHQNTDIVLEKPVIVLH